MCGWAPVKTVLRCSKDLYIVKRDVCPERGYMTPLERGHSENTLDCRAVEGQRSEVEEHPVQSCSPAGTVQGPGSEGGEGTMGSGI